MVPRKSLNVIPTMPPYQVYGEAFQITEQAVLGA
jgi:hypothetical protein